MALSKEHFGIIVNRLVEKLHQDYIVHEYILSHPHSFEYQSNYLAYYVHGKLVKFIDLTSEFTYLTQSEHLEFLDHLLVETKKVIDEAYESDNLLEYYLNKVEKL